MSDRMTITFTAHPIETAPKDREIAAYTHSSGWVRVCWDVEENLFEIVPAYNPLGMQLHLLAPTHWAEIEDMRPEKSK
jgi:hypothetical protein